MGHIKEPDGIDFVINGKPLTEKEKIAISNYIRAYNEKHSSKQIPRRTEKTSVSRKKVAV